MNELDALVERWIGRARDGDKQALGELFEQHRPYLRILAQRMLDSRFGQRVDASDVVQQTLLSAYQQFPNFEGHDAAQFVAWLKVIHERAALDTMRAHSAQKRAVHKEVPASDEDQSDRPRFDSPSGRAMLSEDAVQLARALEALPEDQREAVRLRHLEGWPLKQIADELDRSEEAAAGLVKRGMAKLRQQLRDSSPKR